MWRRATVALTMTMAVVAVSCGDASDESAVPVDAVEAYVAHLDVLEAAVTAWRQAVTLDEARTAAEAAANLVVGPNGPGYGDRNGDGEVDGANAEGLLPGLDGTPPGLATPLAENECIRADVLGGDWTDPAAEWAAMNTAIADWRPNRNTMPTLASHPMRVVGWATFTLDADSVEEAHEYAGHAQLHVDVSRRAVDC